MNHLIAIVTLLFSVACLNGEEATTHERLTELKKLSAAITKETTKEQIVKLLGEPISKSTSAWTHPERELWHYYNFIDDSEYRRFTIAFNRENECEVIIDETTRAEVEKLPLIISTGKVIDTIPNNNPEKGNNSFLCHVEFDQKSGGYTIGVSSKFNHRVTGIPEAGATIRIEHRTKDMNYIFLSKQELYLHSITFTKPEKEAVVPSGNK